MFDKSHPAVILGLSENGLAIGRSLGRQGIKVYGIGYSKGYAYYSKYISGLVFPNPKDQETGFLKCLEDFCQKIDKKPVLFIECDHFLKFYERNNSFIYKHFLVNLPHPKLIHSISDKFLQYQLAVDAGVNVPKTFFADDFEKFHEIKDEIEYPVFVKARDVNIWRKKVSGHKKGFVINSEQELSEKLKSLYKDNVPVVIQEIIKSSDDQNYKVCVFITNSGEFKLVFTLRKIHQYPVHFGIGASVKSYKYSLLEEAGKKLFSSIGYNGVGSAEFKLDEKDNKLKLIEINPRYWQQNSLADFSGMNFPLMDYKEATNQSPNAISEFQENYLWINLYSSIQSYFGYREKGEITFRKWRRDLKGKKTISFLAFDDLTPLFIHIYRIVIRILVRYKKKFYK